MKKVLVSAMIAALALTGCGAKDKKSAVEDAKPKKEEHHHAHDDHHHEHHHHALKYLSMEATKELPATGMAIYSGKGGWTNEKGHDHPEFTLTADFGHKTVSIDAHSEKLGKFAVGGNIVGSKITGKHNLSGGFYGAEHELVHAKAGEEGKWKMEFEGNKK